MGISFGVEDAELYLHSHITGVDPALQGRPVGFALKQFQRTWALERGARTVRWTADPLVRANMFFNLGKLGPLGFLVAGEALRYVSPGSSSRRLEYRRM